MIDMESSDEGECASCKRNCKIKIKYSENVLESDNMFKYPVNGSDTSEVSLKCVLKSAKEAGRSECECFKDIEEKSYENVKKITIEFTNGCDKCIECLNSVLKKCEKVEHISLHHFYYKNGYIKSLFEDVDFSNIKTLELYNVVTLDESANIGDELKDKMNELKNIKNIRFDAISYKSVEKIFSLLSNKDNVESIELANIGIKNDKLCDEINKFQNLKRFNFSDNPIKRSIMVDLIRKLPNGIETINFDELYNLYDVDDENEIVSNGAEELIKRDNQNLKRLSLRNSSGYIKSVHIIIDNLDKFSELIEFRFDYNRVSGLDINKLCINLKKLKNLEVVSLMKCNMCDKPFEELCKSLCEVAKLKELYISGNTISDINPLIESINRYKCLEYLCMCGEDIKYEDITKLLDNISKLDKFKRMKFDKIKLSKCELIDLEKKVEELKKDEKEIIIGEVIDNIEDEDKLKYNIEYIQSYRSGFMYGFCGLSYEDNYYMYDTKESINGFYDGYDDGQEYKEESLN